MKIIDNLKLTFQFYSDNFLKIFLISCLPSLLISLLSQNHKYFSGNSYYYAYIAMVLLSSFFNLATIVTVQNIKDKLGLSLKKSLKLFFPAILLNIVVFVITLSGYIAFIIPGIFLSIILQLVIFAYCDRQKGIIDSITITRFYLRKKTLIVLINTIVVGLLYAVYTSFVYSLVSSLKVDAANPFNIVVVSLISSLISPVQTIFFNNLYQDIKSSVDISLYEKFPKNSKLIGFSIIFSCIFVSAIFIFAMIKITRFFN